MGVRARERAKKRKIVTVDFFTAEDR